MNPWPSLCVWCVEGSKNSGVFVFAMFCGKAAPTPSISLGNVVHSCVHFLYPSFITKMGTTCRGSQSLNHIEAIIFILSIREKYKAWHFLPVTFSIGIQVD